MVIGVVPIGVTWGQLQPQNFPITIWIENVHDLSHQDTVEITEQLTFLCKSCLCIKKDCLPFRFIKVFKAFLKYFSISSVSQKSHDDLLPNLTKNKKKLTTIVFESPNGRIRLLLALRKNKKNMLDKIAGISLVSFLFAFLGN